MNIVTTVRKAFSPNVDTSCLRWFSPIPDTSTANCSANAITTDSRLGGPVDQIVFHRQRRQRKCPAAREPDQRVEALISRRHRDQTGETLGHFFGTHPRIIAPG